MQLTQPWAANPNPVGLQKPGEKRFVVRRVLLLGVHGFDKDIQTMKSCMSLHRSDLVILQQ